MTFSASFRSFTLYGILCAFYQAQDFPPMEKTIAEPEICGTVTDYVLQPKPWWLRIATKEWQWVTIDPKIYYPPSIDPLSRLAVIEHEKIHLSQQRKMGKIKWIFRYAVSKEFRLEQELEPIIVEISYTPLERRKKVAERYAVSLSGPPYHRAAKSYGEVLERILSKAAEMDVGIGNLMDKN